MTGRTRLCVVVLALIAFVGAAPAHAVDNGPIAYDRDDGIHVVNPDGSFDSRVTEAGVGWPAWSPDGRRIAYSGAERIRRGRVRGQARCPRSATGLTGWCYGLYVQNVYRSTRRRVAFGHVNSAPTWSPDGKRIAYGRWNRPFANTGDLWAVAVRGGTPVRLTHGGKRDFPLDPDWSPDGSRIAFDWHDAIFSKDAYGSWVSYSTELRVIRANGSDAPAVIGGGSNPPPGPRMASSSSAAAASLRRSRPRAGRSAPSVCAIGP